MKKELAIIIVIPVLLLIIGVTTLATAQLRSRKNIEPTASEEVDHTCLIHGAPTKNAYTGWE